MECGEGKQKEGEEIVLCVCCYWTEAESDREKHSVPIPPIRCSLVPIPPPIPAKTLKTNNNPIVVHRTPAVRSVLWFRQDRLGRCL